MNNYAFFLHSTELCSIPGDENIMYLNAVSLTLNVQGPSYLFD